PARRAHAHRDSALPRSIGARGYGGSRFGYRSPHRPRRAHQRARARLRLRLSALTFSPHRLGTRAAFSSSRRRLTMTNPERGIGLRAKTSFPILLCEGPHAAHCRAVELSATGIVVERGRELSEREQRASMKLELFVP